MHFCLMELLWLWTEKDWIAPFVFFCMWPKGFSVLWNEVQGGAGCQDGWIIETRLILWQTFLLYWVTVKTTGAPDAAVCHNPTFELCFSTPTLPCFPWAVCVWHLVCLEYIWLLCYGSQTAADAFTMNRVHMYKWWTNTCSLRSFTREKTEKHRVVLLQWSQAGTRFHTTFVLGLMSQSQLRHLGDNFLYWSGFTLHFCVMRCGPCG